MDDAINNLVTDLDAASWAQVLNLFDELSQLNPAEQDDCLAHVEISVNAKKLLKKMLETQHEPHMLDQTVDPLVAALFGEDAVNQLINPADIVGRTFGAWQALESLGTGGMGQVFLAKRADEQYEKQVALKVIKSGQYSKLSQQRFQTEMRTLAQFEHPHIAHLIDGGTSEDGIIYFVMELVSGEPIIDYANAKQLNLHDRIELLLQVIDAVEYAHQSLIIHGDIKPANILVNQSGQVKLVDFGIARSFDEDTSDRYLPQFTPSYSAPEQTQGKILTTASDVFGLCAVLYELCTGTSPRSSESLTTFEAYTEQLITPIPSAFSNYQENISDNNSAMLKSDNKMGRALSSELGAIIDKGLQIAVVDRYQNTTSLRRDLLLFLEGSAVPSYANNWFYRWKKSISQHKWPVGVSFMGLVAIIVTALVAINQAQMAQQEAEKANWSNQFLLSIFDHADPVKNQQQPITVNLLTQVASEQLLNDQINLDPQVFTNALSMLGNIQSKLGEAESAANLHAKQIETIHAHGGDLSELAQAHFDLGMDFQQLGKFKLAMENFQQARSVIPIDEKVTHIGVAAMQSMALTHLRLGEIARADAIISALLSIEEKILQADKPFMSMTNVFIAKARLEIAKSNYELALTAVEKTKRYAEKTPPSPIFSAEVLGIEASIHASMKKFNLAGATDQKVVEIFKSYYGMRHPETMIALANQATHLGQGGNYAGAIDAYLEIVGMVNELAVPDFFAPIMYQNLAHQYRRNKQCEHAMAYFKQAEMLFQSIESRRVVGELNTANGLARCYFQLNDLALSEQYFEQAILIAKQQFGTEHKTYAQNQLMRVDLLLKQNKLMDAKRVLNEVEQIFLQEYAESSHHLANLHLKWAALYDLLGEKKQATQKANQAITIYKGLNTDKVYDQSIVKAQAILGT